MLQAAQLSQLVAPDADTNTATENPLKALEHPLALATLT
jgi:hypothetical protein